MTILTVMAALKPEQIRVTLSNADAEFVRDFQKVTGLSMADISGTLLRAAILAAREHAGGLTLPIRFAVVATEKTHDEKKNPAPVPTLSRRH